MSFNKDWDVDQYRTEHESEEHWQLRRDFMIAHKDKFSEERLVCLAQVFTNVEFLGCRYPTETMQLVAQLSEGVADDYREKQKSKLQRTFVKASDAAGAKVKGLKRPAADAAGSSQSFSKYSKQIGSLPQVSDQQNTEILESDKEDKSISKEIHKNTENKTNDCKTKCSPPKPNENTSLDVNSEPNKVTEEKSQVTVKDVTANSMSTTNNATSMMKVDDSNKDSTVVESVDCGIFGNFVLLENEAEINPAAIIERSAAACQIPFRIEYEDSAENVFCTLYLNGHLLSSESAPNKKTARKISLQRAYEKLREICYVLKIKKKFVADSGNIINKDMNNSEEAASEFNAQEQCSSLDTPLAESIGSKLMRAMGWTGGGLGKDKQGIEEPVRLSQQVDRAGLGLPKGELNRKQFRATLDEKFMQYAQKDTPYDLVFANDFSSEERAMMHQSAMSWGLKSKSYGKGTSRHLVVSKRKDFVQIVETMLLSGQLSTDLYDVIKPRYAAPTCEQENASVEALSLKPPLSNVSGLGGQHSSKAPGVPEVICLEGGTEEKLKPLCNETVTRYSALHGLQRTVTFAKKIYDTIYGSLILIEDENCTSPIQIIERSANSCHVPFRYEYETTKGGMLCKFFLSNLIVTSATQLNKKKARELAVISGIAKLKTMCYTLKTEIKVNGDKFSVMKILKKPGSIGTGTDVMCVSKNVDHECLGLKNTNGVNPAIFKYYVNEYLMKYARDDSVYDLVIPPEFSAPERMFIQKTACAFGLKSSLYEVQKKDYLVLYKKQSVFETVDCILRSGVTSLKFGSEKEPIVL